MKAKRKIDHQGRVTIPSELLETFQLKKNDIVEFTNNEEYILLKKYHPEFVCSVTGKITDDGEMIGNAFISSEGLKIIKEYLDKKNS